MSSDSPSLVTTSLLAVAIIFPILGSLAIFLRVYLSIAKVKRLFADDYVIVVAQICSWGISIDIFVAAALGGVNYTKGSVIGATIVFLRTLWIEGFVLIGSLVFVKVSILLYYQRIFVTRGFQIAVWIYVSILLAWGFAMIMAQLFCSKPITAAWDPYAVNALRFNYDAFSVTFAAMSLVFDLIVLCFPIPVIHQLMMSTHRKLKVLGIFWLGIFCCIASAIRLYYIYFDIYKSTATTGTDRYSVVTNAFTWGTIEPNASIVAACLPTFGHLFSASRGLRSVVQNLWSRVSTRTGTTSAGKQSGVSQEEFSEAQRTSNGSFSQGPSSRDQWQRLRVEKTFSVDVELGNNGYEDHYPLVDCPP
ncbi:uncharacterized protein N7483_008720 [Penicillium malachiteum]|uniref:uncharacterized protein n=1 Tax=Penicillium malachiteum TaxID=1324776 RepID=UPI00254947EA|nr:uncharacterized protein N7483_008720 [Penicillium malachiteum]KAJ5720786.1 hypothetical protein N7483_008720 [Penicillium malachiteum]